MYLYECICMVNIHACEENKDTWKAFMLNEQVMTQNTVTKDENHHLKKYWE